MHLDPNQKTCTNVVSIHLVEVHWINDNCWLLALDEKENGIIIVIGFILSALGMSIHHLNPSNRC